MQAASVPVQTAKDTELNASFRYIATKELAFNTNKATIKTKGLATLYDVQDKKSKKNLGLVSVSRGAGPLLWIFLESGLNQGLGTLREKLKDRLPMTATTTQTIATVLYNGHTFKEQQFLVNGITFMGILSGTYVDRDGNFVGSAIMYSPLSSKSSEEIGLLGKSEAQQLVDSLVYKTVIDTNKSIEAFGT